MGQHRQALMIYVFKMQDYAKAERWLIYNTAPLIKHSIAGVTYLADGRVFYREPDMQDPHYFLADARTGKGAVRVPAARVAHNLTCSQNIDPDANNGNQRSKNLLQRPSEYVGPDMRHQDVRVDTLRADASLAG